MSTDGNITLVDQRSRKYLTAIERQRFVEAAETDPIPAVQTFTLAVRHCDVDLENLALRFKTLKRREDCGISVDRPLQDTSSG